MDILCKTCAHINVCKFQKKYIRKIKREFPAVTPCFYYDEDTPPTVGFKTEDKQEESH